MSYKRNTEKASPRRSSRSGSRMFTQNKNIANYTESVEGENIKLEEKFKSTNATVKNESHLHAASEPEITAQKPDIRDIRIFLHQDANIVPDTDSPIMFEMNSDHAAITAEELFESSSPLSSQENDPHMLTDTDEEDIHKQDNYTISKNPIQFNQDDIEIDDITIQPQFDESKPDTQPKKGAHKITKPAEPSERPLSSREAKYKANEAILELLEHVNIMAEDANINLPETSQDPVTTIEQSAPIAPDNVYPREKSPATPETVNDMIQGEINSPVEFVARVTKKPVKPKKISSKGKVKAREPPIDGSIAAMEEGSQMVPTESAQPTTKASRKNKPAVSSRKATAAAKKGCSKKSSVAGDTQIIDLTDTESVNMLSTHINPVATTKIVQVDEIPMDDKPVNSVFVAKAPMDVTPVDQVPFNRVPMDDALFNQVSVDNVLMDDVPVNQVSVDRKHTDIEPVAEELIYTKSFNSESPNTESLNTESPTRSKRRSRTKNVVPGQYNAVEGIESAGIDPITAKPLEFEHVDAETGSNALGKKRKAKKPVKYDPSEDIIDIFAIGNTDVKPSSTTPTSKKYASAIAGRLKKSAKVDPIQDELADSIKMKSNDNTPIKPGRGRPPKKYVSPVVVEEETEYVDPEAKDDTYETTKVKSNNKASIKLAKGRKFVKPATVQDELMEEPVAVETPSRKRVPTASTAKKTPARKAPKKTQENDNDALEIPGKKKRDSADNEELRSKKAAAKKAPTKKVAIKPSTEVSQNDASTQRSPELVVTETQEPTRRAKRSTATIASYYSPPLPQYDDDYIIEDEPHPKRVKKTASKGKEREIVVEKPKTKARANSRQKSKETTGMSMDEGHIGTSDAEEDYDPILYALIHSKSSTLATIDMKTLIPKLLEALPAEDQQELCELLPKPDRINKKGKYSIRPGFESPSNNYFWEALSQWQDIMYVGGFEKEPGGDSTKKKDDSFKDENYEAYWGERVKRSDTKNKTTHDETLASSTRGRGRGRGRSRA